MRTKNFFALAATAMVLALSGCSDDNDITGSELGPDGQPLGPLVEGMSISFGANMGPNSRAYAGVQNGEGTENNIYEAFVFAHEANPKHTRPMDGDWTVIRVTSTTNSGYDAAGIANTGRNTDTTPRKDMQPLAPGETTDNGWLVKNVASFSGVRQGENVYVIANDPNMTLEKAEALCHKGAKSEETIKAYVTDLNKEYVGSMTFRPELLDAGTTTGKELPKGQFIMGGMDMIPVSPTVPSNGTFEMTVGVDRELAKVDYSVAVTAAPADAAYQKIAFKGDDGIVVARIARKASMFTQQNADFYVPTLNCIEDWPINDHSKDAANKYFNLLCDNTPAGSLVFDGTRTATTDWNGVIARGLYNTSEPAGNASEYRYSWKLASAKDADVKTMNDKFITEAKKDAVYTDWAKVNTTASDAVKNAKALEIAKGNQKIVVDAKGYDVALAEIVKDELVKADNYAYISGTQMLAPAFYTTPNYSNNTNAVTVICTQATYVGPTVYMKMGDYDRQAVLVKYLPKAMAIAGVAKIEFQPALTTEAGADAALAAVEVVNPMAAITGDALTALQAAVDAILVKGDFAAFYNGMTEADYKATTKNYDAAYQTALLLYRKDLGVALKVGDKVGAVDITDLAKYPGYKTYPNVSSFSTSKLLGLTDVNDKGIALPLMDAAGATAFDNSIKDPAAITLRHLDMTTQANFDYHYGMKLYYRADVSNYTDNKSNKITERNMYYKTKATITSMGAKSVHEAIHSEENTMNISVEVKKWKLSVQEINI